MKRFINSLAATAMFALAFPTNAGEYLGYPRNWWPEANGDARFYVLDSTNSNWVTGLCGSGSYLLKAGKTNYDTTFISLILAASKSNLVRWQVTSCSGNVNIVDQAKVCTFNADC